MRLRTEALAGRWRVPTGTGVDDLDRAAACVGGLGSRSASGIAVPAAAATGVILELVPRPT